MLTKKSTPTMFGLLSRAVFLSIAIAIIVSGISIGCLTYRIVLNAYGTARIDILKQVSESNNLNRQNMESILSQITHEITPQMIFDNTDRIQQTIDDEQAHLDRFHLDYSIDVVLRDKRTFSSVAGSEQSLQNLLSSYWYMKQLSGESEISWYLRFMSPDDLTSYAQVCSQSVIDETGTVVAIVVLNSTQESLFSTYQKIVEEGERAYILDDKGIIVSHTNQNMIGQWLKSMNAFEKQPGFNSYVVKNYGQHSYIMSNYHDPVSGWTFIEEHDITPVYKSILHASLLSFVFILIGGILATYLGYRYTKRVSKSLADMTEAVYKVDPSNLEPIESYDSYHEIHVLSTSFNELICRTQELIRDIELREAEKRRTEYDFQQAQLSPHFLHNTLVAIKSLIYMGEYAKAQQMLEKFVELLNIPRSAEIQFVTLEAELHLIENYISIMNCRTDKTVVFNDHIPEEYRNILIPRMLLQPVVGNSIFHGFAEKDKDCQITVSASMSDNILSIVLSDNGEGISKTRLNELAGNDYKSDGHHHGIGIKNIRKRLLYIYGGRSAVELNSQLGIGTSVVIKIDQPDNLPFTATHLRDTSHS